MMVPYDQAVATIEQTRICREFDGLRPISKLCLECPKAGIYDISDPSGWDCELFWMDNHEPYYVPTEGEECK